MLGKALGWVRILDPGGSPSRRGVLNSANSGRKYLHRQQKITHGVEASPIDTIETNHHSNSSKLLAMQKHLSIHPEHVHEARCNLDRLFPHVAKLVATIHVVSMRLLSLICGC